MYAIIREGGGQRKVVEGDVVLIDLIDQGKAAKGKSISFDHVLAIGTGDGKAVARIGTPYVAGASVTAEVVEPLVQGDKVYIHKFRRRKGFKKKTGHRQSYTRIKVTSIKG